MLADDIEKIPAESGLLRRVHPQWWKFDSATGKRRLSSAAFNDPRMSVDVEPMMIADGKDWHFTLRAHPNFFLVRLRAGVVRGLGRTIEYKPRPPEQPDNPYHAEVVGKAQKPVSRKLRDSAEWVQKPHDA